MSDAKDDIYMAGPWITDLEEKTVLDALRNGWYGKNAYHYVEAFEAEFARYHDRKFALMTPNCTTALHLLLAGLGIGEGDEVIAPDCTWVGSVACITYQRASTVLADIDAEHWCLTPESIERAITPKTKAVIVVDLYGNMPDWDGILDSAADVAFTPSRMPRSPSVQNTKASALASSASAQPSAFIVPRRSLPARAACCSSTMSNCSSDASF